MGESGELHGADRPSSMAGWVKIRGELALGGVGELQQPGLEVPQGRCGVCGVPQVSRVLQIASSAAAS